MIRVNRSQQTNRRPTIALALLSAGISALATLGGCAGQGDVDRSQPDKVDKAIFFNADGTPKVFYYRPTIVEVPPTTGSYGAFEGETGGLDKLYFVITNDALIGYRSYDYVPGTQNAITGGANNKDTPIISIPIKSHFDVKREYNPGTGEQTNVISENTSDRPPLERQYMRLGWSSVSDAEIGSQYRPIATADHIEFTIKPSVDVDYGACAMFNTYTIDDSSWDCGTSEIKIRYSFTAVKPSTYQALEYPDRAPLVDASGKQIPLIQNFYPCTPKYLAQAGGTFSGADCAPAAVDQFSKFGFFRTVRQNYDRRAGVTEAARKYYINRWNIWGPDVDKLDVDGKTIQDERTKANVKRHSVKPIVFYTNVEWPDEDPAMFDTATQVAKDWNQTMRETVAALEMTEANPGSTVDAGELTMRLADTSKYTKIDDVVLLKQNDCNLKNVQAILNKNPDLARLVQTNAADTYGAPKVDVGNLTKANLVQACSVMEAATIGLPDTDPKKFSWQRLGDLRYSFFHWVDRPQVSGPLGFGPSAADPETGEIISANLSIYGAAMDTSAQSAADAVEVLNGQISIDDLLSGKTILDVLQSTATKRQARDAKQLTPEAKAYFQAMARGAAADQGPRQPGCTDRCPDGGGAPGQLADPECARQAARFVPEGVDERLRVQGGFRRRRDHRPGPGAQAAGAEPRPGLREAAHDDLPRRVRSRDGAQHGPASQLFRVDRRAQLPRRVLEDPHHQAAGAVGGEQHSHAPVFDGDGLRRAAHQRRRRPGQV